jgi:hypothetical protein
MGATAKGGHQLDQSFPVRGAVPSRDSPSFRRLFCIHDYVLSENGRVGNEVAGRILSSDMSIKESTLSRR